MTKIIIAIDGYSACGKSSTAKILAKRLNYTYIDTGAMYRAITLFLIQNNIDLTDTEAIKIALPKAHITFVWNKDLGQSETFLNGENVENEIRKMYVSEKVSQVSAIADVRNALVSQQRILGKEKGVVMDGRDIGTNVYPEAELKIFMTATLDKRAERRQQELAARGENETLEKIMENLTKRDYIDSNRKESPLRKAEDAKMLNTDNHTIESQVEFILDLVFSKEQV